MSMVQFVVRATTVCGAFFAIRHVYDNDRRIHDMYARVLDKVVARAVEDEYRHQK